MYLTEPLNGFGAHIFAGILPRSVEEERRRFVTVLLGDDEDGVLAQTLGAGAALLKHMPENRQCLVRVHLHQALQRREAHVVVVARATTLLSELRRELSPRQRGATSTRTLRRA